MRAYIYQLSQFLLGKLKEEDKVKHIVWSFWMTLAALALWSAPLAFMTVFVLGLAKECWDSFYGSGFCWFDMTGNLLGSLAGLLCGLFLSFLF